MTTTPALTTTAIIAVEKTHDTDMWGRKLPDSERLFVSVAVMDAQWDSYLSAMDSVKIGRLFSDCADVDLNGDGLTHGYFVCRTQDEVKTIREEVKRVNRLVRRQHAGIAA